MSPESGEFAHPLAADPQTTAGETALLAVGSESACGGEQLLIAGPAHEVALDGGLELRVRIRIQRSLDPGRHGHRRLDMETDVDGRAVVLAFDQVGRRGL